MDVEKGSFFPKLLRMLDDISNAHFISIDLELSGISRQPNYRQPSDPSGHGPQTLQQRYAETKEAAERYQVLQFGFTCVEEDVETKTYLLRPYNLNVNPLVEERLDIERIFSFQSGAVEFLLEHGFRLDVPFTHGVPYLSRQEEAQARLRAVAREEGSTISDIDLKEDDHDSLDFVQRARDEITAWKGRTTREPDFVNIAPPGMAQRHNDTNGLTNFQKRLVHQLVRAEFPDLVTISKPTFIQVVAFDQLREDSIRQGRRRRFEEQLCRQTGLRWLLEAMVGGDLTDLKGRNFMRSLVSEPVYVDVDAMKVRLDGIRDRLKDKRTVLVGHNVFTDLVNLYRMFFGILPDRVEDFQRHIHELFPLIVDTKYLATHNSRVMNPRSSLQEIEEQLRKQEMPVMETHSHHLKYAQQGAAHEAGYDSFLTAEVLVRLSAKLEVAGEHRPGGPVAVGPEDNEPALQNGGVPLNLMDTDVPTGKENTRLAVHRSNPSNSSLGGGVPLFEDNKTNGTLIDAAHTGRRRRKRKNRKRPIKSGAVHSAFSHAGMFDTLLELEGEDEGHEEEEVEEEEELDTSAVEGASDAIVDEVSPAREADMTMMPRFGSDFWTVYGNRLRVFGTQEGFFTGLGAVTPLGVGLRRSWSGLLDGHCGIVDIRHRSPAFAALPSHIAGVVPSGKTEDGGWHARDWMTPGEERRMATFSQYATAAADEALEDAGWKPREGEEQEVTGVCLGSGIGSLDDAYETSIAFAEGGYKKVSPMFVPRLLINLAAGHLSMKYGFKGPNHAVTTACTTGAHAIGDASRFIAFGDADVMIAGGAESCIHPLAMAGFARARSLVTTFNDRPQAASRPFDRDRAGFVMGEGAGVMILEELEHARARHASIYAEVAGYGTSGDAHHMTAPSPSGDGAYLAMRRALKNAHLPPSAVDYINAHATSTVLGDAAENRAIRRLMLGPLGKSSAAEVNVSSSKGAMGHLLGAAGAVEGIFSVLAIMHNILLPTLNLDVAGDPPEEFDCNYVARTPQERTVDVALSNSFGFGGTNASLCFVRYRA
ncbi:MAG: Mitochondrial beta-keto-acyl synthase [Caeruleum heppii]|nr:MAG: Mitochondrial beta-keto-acyl synthase [Caeruleum heppii]